MLTKQDLQKILSLIRQQSVRDSQFPIAPSIGEGDVVRIPALHNGHNRLITLEMLLRYLSSHIEIAGMEISVSWSDKHTLGGVLNDLYEAASSAVVIDEDTGEAVRLIASNVAYTKEGTDYVNVGAALDSLIDSIESAVDRLDGLDTKADLLGPMLHPDQWPQTVILNVEYVADIEAIASEGDIYFDVSSNKLKLIGLDDNAEFVYTDLDKPQESTVYCVKSTGFFYRWDNSTERFIPVGGGQGGGDVSVVDDIIDGSQDAVTSGAVAAALSDISQRIDGIDTAVNPVKYGFVVSPKLAEYTGNAVNVTLTATVTKGGVAQSGYNVLINMDGSSSSTSPWQTAVTTRASHNASAKFIKDGVTKETLSGYIRLMHRFKYGFYNADDAANVSPSVLSKTGALQENLSYTVNNLTNPSNENYLWICYDDSLGDSLTVSTGVFPWDMQYAGAYNGRHYWRSTKKIDAGTYSFTTR